MLEYYSELFERYRSNGLLLDSNLLLLYVVGSHDDRLVESFKRTRIFTLDDFRLLVRIVAFFERVVTTPHILTEVNGFSNQLPKKSKFEYYGTFGAKIEVLEEQLVGAASVAETSAFRLFGLTDAVIKGVAQEQMLVLSADLDLVVHLHNSGLDAVNFNNIRPVG